MPATVGVGGDGAEDVVREVWQGDLAFYLEVVAGCSGCRNSAIASNLTVHPLPAICGFFF